MFGSFQPTKAIAILAIGAAIVAIYPVAHFAAAHEGAKGVVKERMDAMSDLGRAAKAMTEMFKGQQRYDPEAVARLAKSMAAHADKLPAMFHHGSDGHPSKTLAKAWSDRADFVQAFATLKAQARKLGEMAPTATQRESMVQFFKMSRTCSSCHTTYRAPK